MSCPECGCKDYEDMDCEDCDGTGENPDYDEDDPLDDQVCDYCGGTGNADTVRCTECGFVYE